MMKFKIKHKLFLAIITANIFIVLGIYILSSLSFSSSFREYLDANREKELAPMVDAVAREYQNQQDWHWLRERGRSTWRTLIETYYVPRNSNPDRAQFRPQAANGERPPRPRPDNRPLIRQENRPVDRRAPQPGLAHDAPRPRPPVIFIADKDHRLLLGREDKLDTVNWIAITLENQTVGYLGYHRTTHITSQLDQLFVDKLTTNLIWIVIFVIIISALIALIQSRFFVKPIIKLSNAAHKISKGEFTTRITVSSDDEIGELCQDFNRLATSLDRNLKARQQWIADISHELRTPVAILQGELEALQDGIRDYSAESVNSLYQEVKRLAFLINDLHELSMSDIGALSYRFENVDLIEILDQVIESKKESIDSAGFSIEQICEQDELILKGDEHRLNQLFLNLLNNSLAYSDPNGMVKVAVKTEGPNVIISWSDTAPGVTEEQLTKLFDRLYRTESSRNRNSGGSGIGLSIAKNIVEAHNGTITARPSSLDGVRFDITLPLK
ncbi:sensor histidine kinase [Shewanella sediminis HAW-EB3]|uniref:histidine kinase n=1 Tax=Shewanella sediminis (strain HAW-EB3) TaxID=425104 RepID=A8FWH3_SHESH|nr:ATP-binding protein [Shewanella sediminis]ABV37196.1 sensor histidine kinase [Shewanella sediminis HAW-EB3]